MGAAEGHREGKTRRATDSTHRNTDLYRLFRRSNLPQGRRHARPAFPDSTRASLVRDAVCACDASLRKDRPRVKDQTRAKSKQHLSSHHLHLSAQLPRCLLIQFLKNAQPIIVLGTGQIKILAWSFLHNRTSRECADKSLRLY